MKLNELFEIKENVKSTDNKPVNVNIDGKVIWAYPNSIFKADDVVFFIGKENTDKFLFLVEGKVGKNHYTKFEGEIIQSSDEKYRIKKCPLTNKNRVAIQSIFDFTNPVILGVNNSFGFGDRLGLANPGHVRSLAISKFKPIFAQQSIRELTRTNRTADEVMDAAVWAVFQEGYTSGFGSDADHLKTTDDIDMMLNAGFTMFTFDPGEHVNNNADTYSEDQLYSVVAKLPWSGLKDTFPAAERRYSKKEIVISPDFKLNVSEHDFLKAYAKYGNAILHIKKMFDHLKKTAGKRPYEVEVSVDETESITTPFEHYFFSNELKRLEVGFVSLAPRFVGSFEKGIDYKGDLELFKTEYLKHLAIAKHFGHYKISLHSGSDKFSVYNVIGSIKGSATHVKTAGTSYLEALKVVAIKEPALFRKIFDFGLGLYEIEKNSYHVSADIKNLRKGDQYSDKELIELFSSEDARQVLHVTFGKVLTGVNEDGSFTFKTDILNCLKKNEDTHYDIIIKHFHKHLMPFN